jgi:hypothetical protein
MRNEFYYARSFDSKQTRRVFMYLDTFNYLSTRILHVEKGTEIDENFCKTFGINSLFKLLRLASTVFNCELKNFELFSN